MEIFALDSWMAQRPSLLGLLIKSEESRKPCTSRYVSAERVHHSGHSGTALILAVESQFGRKSGCHAVVTFTCSTTKETKRSLCGFHADSFAAGAKNSATLEDSQKRSFAASMPPTKSSLTCSTRRQRRTRKLVSITLKHNNIVVEPGFAGFGKNLIIRKLYCNTGLAETHKYRRLNVQGEDWCRFAALHKLQNESDTTHKSVGTFFQAWLSAA